MELEGVIPPMVTPVSSRSGEIDVESVRSLTEFLVANGVHGLFPAGTMGEFTSLSTNQRTTLIEAVVEAAAGRPVLAGCGGTSLEVVKTNISRAREVGADAAVVITPYYLDTSQSAICDFFEHIADETQLPIILYTNPPRTGLEISPDSVCRLAEHENIIGLKDTSDDAGFFMTISRRVPDSFSLLIGSTELSIAALDVGADGLVAAPSNIVPEATVEMYEAYRRGDRTRADSIFRSVLMPVVIATRSVPGVGAIKYLLQLSGYAVGEPLLPFPTLGQEDRQSLEQYHRETLTNAGVGTRAGPGVHEGE